jgi:hypothetical protein
LKDVLFKDKKVIIYTRFFNDDPNVIPFGEIWISLMQNLGATVVGIESGEPFSRVSNKTATLESKLEFCRKSKQGFFSNLNSLLFLTLANFDILLTENDCEHELAECASEKNALAVSSEWVIQVFILLLNFTIF